MKIFCRLGAIILFLSVGLTAIASAETVDRIVATVNGQIITYQEVQRLMAPNLAQAGELTPEDRAKLEKMALDSLINQTLIAQQAKKLKIEVSPEEIDSAVANIMASNKMTPETFTKSLAASNLSMDDLRTNLKAQILEMKVVGIQVRSKVLITEDEIKKYYKEHEDELKQENKVHLRALEFLIPEKADEAAKAKIMKEAADLRAEAIKSKDFVGLVRKHSKGAYADAGGDMGLVPIDDLSGAIKKGIANLKAGELSQPVQVGGEIMIIQVVKWYLTADQIPDEARLDIQRRLTEEQVQEMYGKWMQELKEKAVIKIKL